MPRTLRQLIGLALDTDTEARSERGLRRTRCLHCRAHLTSGGDGEPLGATTLEHIVPFALGGLPTVENLCLLCTAHNAHSARKVFGDVFIC